MAEPFQDTLDVTVDAVVYTFKIPTIMFDLEVSGRAADIRRRAYPAGGGTSADQTAYFFSRNAALLELYLKAATDQWPFSGGTDGKPVVDFTKFPLERIDAVYEVGNAFDAELARFRKPRAADGAPASP